MLIRHAEPAVAIPPRPDLIQHYDAIVRELAERGIRPRPLTVLSHALDVGHPEAIAVEIAAMVEEPRR